MNRLSHLKMVAVIMGACMACTAGMAQEPSRKGPAPDLVDNVNVLEVVNLKQVNASNVVSTIKQIAPAVSASALDDRTLVLSGLRSQVDVLLAKIIPAADSADTQRGGTDFLSVRHYPVNELMPLIRAAAPRAVVGIDELNRLVIAQGSESERNAIRTVIEKVDQPRRAAKLQLFFLRGNIGAVAEAQESSNRLPSELEGIGKTLRANGFGRLSVIAPMLLTVQEGEKFESRARLHSGEESRRDDLDFSADGLVRVAGASQAANLTIQARVTGESSRGTEGAGKVVFEVYATVEAKLGEYVLLTAAPSSSADGNAMAIVLRITSD